MISSHRFYSWESSEIVVLGVISPALINGVCNGILLPLFLCWDSSVEWNKRANAGQGFKGFKER